jgi:hypothetical protein
MKTNKIMFVGAAFLMMISCDNNSISFHILGTSEATEVSSIKPDTASPLPVLPTAASNSSLKKLSAVFNLKQPYL